MTSCCSSFLTCETVLSPPPQQIGGGGEGLSSEGDDDRLLLGMVYTNRQPAWQCCFSRDGVYLAVCYGAPDPCIRIWKQQPQQQNQNQTQSSSFDWQLHATLEGIHTRTIRSVAFAPINRPLVLASASFDGTVAIWEQQQQQQQLDCTTNTEWDCTAQLEGHENEVKCVTWNATGSLLATCGRDKTVWIWECFLPGTVGGSGGINNNNNNDSNNNEDTDLECIAVLNGHEADVKCVQFASSHDQWGDGDEILLSASYDGTIRVWAQDAGDWYCAACLDITTSSSRSSSSSSSNNNNKPTIWTISVAPSGTRLIAGSDDGSLTIYKCYSAKELQTFADNNNNNNKKEERARTTTSDRAVWKCVGQLPHAHSLSSSLLSTTTTVSAASTSLATVYSCQCAPARVGHGRIVSGGSDNRIQIYREVIIPRQQQQNEQQQQQQAAAAVGGGAQDDDRPLFQLDASATVTSDVNCVCWHPWEGSMLASAGDDGKVRIWNYHQVD